MNGVSQIIPNSILVASIAICLFAYPRFGMSDEPSPDSHQPKASEDAIDPFVDEDKAAVALAGIWEYSADYSLKPQVVRDVPGLVGPDGQRGWPFEEKALGETTQVVRKMSSHVRLDLRSKNKFRIEAAISNHADKTCSYSYGEGTWKLRGRLVVLTFLLDDEIARWGVFIEKLATDEIVVRGIGESAEFFNGGQGVLTRKENPIPVSIPTGYAVEVDEVSYGPARIDIAEFLRDNLNMDVELTKER